MEEDGYDVLFKIILVGDTSVGKTNIINKYIKNEFQEDFYATIGVEFSHKQFIVDNHKIKAQIWDTAGQEAFRSITRTYYKSSTCAFIVYDITDKKTFENVITWLNEVRDMCYKDILICLIGNKCDLETKREISYEDGKNFADENNLLFFETSAKSGINITECFNESATVLVDKIENGQLKLDQASNGIQIGNFPDSEQNENLRKKKKKCC